MIRVLSREADRSMLGLSHCKQVGLERSALRLLVLLQGGSQAGDPAILYEELKVSPNVSQSRLWTFDRSRVVAVAGEVRK